MTNVIKLPYKSKPELSQKIINLIRNGEKMDTIVETLKVSLSSVSRTKKYLTHTGTLKKGITNSDLVKTILPTIEEPTKKEAVEVTSKTTIEEPTKKEVVEVTTKNTQNSYNNVNGVKKEIARNKMAKYIIDSNVEGLVPTLCHIDALIEKKILEHNENFNFIGVERKLETFNQLKETIKRENLPIEAYEGNFSDKIYGAKENQYAHIIGDYCGELPTFASEIEYAIFNKIVKVGGILALTFGKPIRSKCLKSEGIYNLGKFITNDDTSSIRSQSDKAIEGYFQRLIGFNFNLMEIFNYYDDKGRGKGYPMVLIILKRIK